MVIDDLKFVGANNNLLFGQPEALQRNTKALRSLQMLGISLPSRSNIHGVCSLLFL